MSLFKWKPKKPEPMTLGGIQRILADMEQERDQYWKAIALVLESEMDITEEFGNNHIRGDMKGCIITLGSSRLDARSAMLDVGWLRREKLKVGYSVHGYTSGVTSDLPALQAIFPAMGHPDPWNHHTPSRFRVETSTEEDATALNRVSHRVTEAFITVRRLW